MAIKFTDGFDHYPFGYLTSKWSYYSGNSLSGDWNSDTFTTGRLGTGQAYQVNRSRSSQLYKQFATGHATNVIGFAFYVGMNPDREHYLMTLQDVNTGDYILDLRLQTNMTLRLVRGNNTQVGGNSASLSAGRWYYLEVKSIIDPSSGTAELRIDGITAITFTGNTKPGSATTANRLWLSSQNSDNVGRWQIFDDLYWLDGSGATNTDYLGDVRIVALTAAAEGADTAFDLPGGAMTLSQRIVADNPTHFWGLQESAGASTFADDGISSTDLPAVLAGTTAGNVTAGQPGPAGTDKALEFTGGGGARLTLPYDADWNFQGDWTLCFWTNFNCISGQSQFIDRGGNWGLYSRPDSNYSVRGGSNSTGFSQGQWRHGTWDMYHFVKSGSSITCYRNSASYWGQSYSNGGIDSGVMSVMADRGGGSPGSGRIAYIGVWDRALSGVEMARQYSATYGAIASKHAAVQSLDGDGSFIQADAVDEAETFDFSNLTASIQVVGVVLNAFARKDDAGLRSITGVARVGGTDYEDDAVIPLGSSYSNSQYTYDVNPATGLPWTISEVNAAEFGLKVKV